MLPSYRRVGLGHKVKLRTEIILPTLQRLVLVYMKDEGDLVRRLSPGHLYPSGTRS